MEECCGTCKYHKFDTYEKDWYCINDDTEAYGLPTDYEDQCEDWEGK